MTSRVTARRYSGFTAIELVVVVAVTCLIAVLGYSAQRTYTVRAQVSGGIAGVADLQIAVTQAFREHGEVPVTADEIGGSTDAPSDFVESVTVQNGRIDILYGRFADPEITGRRLSLTPYETATLEFFWICGNQIPGPGLYPLGFAGGGRQALQVASTVEARYLPKGCR